MPKMIHFGEFLKTLKAYGQKVLPDKKCDILSNFQKTCYKMLEIMQNSCQTIKK